MFRLQMAFLWSKRLSGPISVFSHKLYTNNINLNDLNTIVYYKILYQILK